MRFRLTMEQKLVAGFGALLLMFSVLLGHSLVSLIRVAKAQDEAADAARTLDLAGEIRAVIAEMSGVERELRMAYASGQPAAAASIRSAHELMFPRFDRAAASIVKLFDTPEERASGDQVTRAVADWKQPFFELTDGTALNKLSAAARLGALRSLTQRMEASANDLATMHRQKLQDADRENDEGVAAAKRIQLILVISAIIVTFWWTRKWRTQHQILKEATERAEAGLREVARSEQEILRLNQGLERRVADRTSELARVASELEVRNREVERANRMKTEFLARMSHELRTPLNAIVGFSDLLAEEPAGPLPPTYKRFAANIQEGAQHLLQVVNDVLDLSKIEAGRIDLKREGLQAADALKDVLSVITPLARIKNIVIENQLPGGVRIIADRTRFKQILYNLLSNAVKFTPEHGRVWIADRSQGDAACFCVGDTGIGIPREELAAIFEEFHQVGPRSGTGMEGTGLGLAITKRLVGLHGGTIWVESAAEGGSRFFFSLGPHSLEPALVLEERV